MTELLSECPVCQATGHRFLFEVNDLFLTGEIFRLVQCENCEFRFINPRPLKSEIGRYYLSDDYISHGIKKRDPISRIYEYARKISIRKKYDIVTTHTAGDHILDIGCGTGELLAYLQQKGLKVTGVEPNAKAREYASGHHALRVFESPEQIPEQENAFDAITMWHVLEHVHDLNHTIGLIKRILKNNGVLIVAVPNSDSWDARHFGPGWAAYDVPRHLYHFTTGTMKQLAGKHGFEVDDILPQKLDAYYVSMLSLKYRHGITWSWLFPFYGFWSNLKSKSKGAGHSSLIFVLRRKKT